MIKIYTYRICKYNPKHRREGGAYLKDEWTDYSDIGRVFSGKVLTESEYLSVERNYIFCIIAILTKLNIDNLYIRNLEKGNTYEWKNGQRVSKEVLIRLIRDCLRNNCWCQLIYANFYLHFGYDYYIYIGCELSAFQIESICKDNNLYCDIKISPYIDEI